jgi:hypothetical protein
MKSEGSRVSRRDKYLRLKYGITVGDYDTLLLAQEGVCAVCGLPPKKRPLVVDHDHMTGEVRGLLHSLCNRSLGMFESGQLVVQFDRYLSQGAEKAAKAARQDRARWYREQEVPKAYRDRAEPAREPQQVGRLEPAVV